MERESMERESTVEALAAAVSAAAAWAAQVYNRIAFLTTKEKKGDIRCYLKDQTNKNKRGRHRRRRHRCGDARLDRQLRHKAQQTGVRQHRSAGRVTNERAAECVHRDAGVVRHVEIAVGAELIRVGTRRDDVAQQRRPRASRDGVIATHFARCPLAYP
jgi:hypothetical protein